MSMTINETIAELRRLRDRCNEDHDDGDYDDLQILQAAAVNALPSLLDTIESQAAEIERLKRDRARFFDGIMEQIDAVTEPELERDVRNLDGYISVWQRQKRHIATLESELATLRAVLDEQGRRFNALMLEVAEKHGTKEP